MKGSSCWRAGIVFLAAVSSMGCMLTWGCGADVPKSNTPSSAAPAGQPTAPVSDAPPADTTGGFDGNRAFEHVAKLVSIGPRTPGSEGIRRAQAYIRAQLEGFGCAVEEDSFTAQTPIGPVAMKNIVGKAAGKSEKALLLLTHYDTRREPAGFVGANDGGSSTGVMLEMARHLCSRKNALSIWIAFLDGEEAFEEWSELDSLYGSRQMAARLAVSGELKKVQAVLLADLVGYRELKFRRESNSTKWLTDLVWATAQRLGYKSHFADDEFPVSDDHEPFLKRGVAAVDIIQLEDYPHWHTKEDTLDKISGRSLAIVGHVLLEVIPALEKKFLSRRVIP
jgi:glutaminyl-peptide cyclotransferase